ncbi:hypothetical protein [Actinoplanes philippinensis]|uniref:hypothetical protein n=1 Tax=Actinoplanes philippinensis TaxID=35752 RepID=UPI0033D1DEE4
MLINGYEENPIVAGEDLVTLPGFWAAYSAWIREQDVPLHERFGVDGTDVDAADEALMNEEAWPAFRIPFSDGHTAVVVYANYPEDDGNAAIDYFVTHADWDRHGYLATVDGHPAGPGLAWRELVHIARTPDPAAPGIQNPHARLLLLLPASGDQDTPADAIETIAEALLWAKVPAGDTERMARQMLDHPMFPAARWAMPASTRVPGGDEAFDGILVCDASSSPRYGIRLAEGITREQNDRLAQALGTRRS